MEQSFSGSAQIADRLSTQVEDEKFSLALLIPIRLVGFHQTGVKIIRIGFGHLLLYLQRYPFAVDFSPDGNYLAAGTLEGIILWKFTPGGVEQVQVLGNPSDENGYYSLAFSPDGTLLAAASADGKIRVWDLETGQARWEMAGGVYVAFSPDGTRLASSWGGITTIHVLPLDELTDLVRSRIIRPMTPEECLTYLHEVSCPAWP